MSETVKHGGKTYHVLQPGESWDGKHGYTTDGKRIRQRCVDPGRAAAWARAARSRKRKAKEE